MPLVIRPCTEAHLDAVVGIYAHHVRFGTASFELEAPDREEVRRRHAEVCGRGWPWLVAEREGEVIGYAYAAPFRPRPAYRFTVEDSVYVRPDAARLGAGRALLSELIGQCHRAGARQMLAVIGDSANAPSSALHRALGFEPAGVLQAVGWKLGAWRDVVLMQRPIGWGCVLAPHDGEGAARPAASPPAPQALDTTRSDE